MSSGQPEDVVVIIPAKNVARTLPEQLAALDAQTDSNFRVIVSDNGSNDNTRELCKHWTTKHLGITVVDSSGRPGAAGARNVGIAQSHEHLLLFCDGDDRVHPTWVASLREALAHADGASGPLYTFTTDKQPRSIWFEKELPISMNHLPFLPSGNMGIRRSVVDAIGTFDEALTLGQEDADFGWRMHGASLRIVHHPLAKIDYRLRSDIRHLLRQQYSYGRAHVQLFAKHHPKELPTASWRVSARWFLEWGKQLPGDLSNNRARDSLASIAFQIGRASESLRQGIRSPL